MVWWVSNVAGRLNEGKNVFDLRGGEKKQGEREGRTA